MSIGDSRLRRSILVGVFAAFVVAGATVAQGSSRVIADSVTVSPEYPFFDPRAPQNQSELDVAWSGSVYFAAWTRAGDLYAGRVNAAGQFLDGAGILLASEANPPSGPRIAWDGTNFLVVWTDRRRSSSSLDVYGARVRPDGLVLDPGGFPIAKGPYLEGGGDVAWDGTNYLVVWTDRRNPGWEDVYGARVAPTGDVLDPGGFPISTARDYQGAPVVAWGGGHFLVAWVDRRTPRRSNGSPQAIYGARVGQDGSVLDPDGFPISSLGTFNVSPRVASDGASHLVVWVRGIPNQVYVQGARVSQGVVLDPDAIEIARGSTNRGDPDVTWDSQNFVAVWRDTEFATVHGNRVSSTGVVLDGAGFEISTVPESTHHNPDVVGRGGGRSAVVYSRWSGPPWITRGFIRFIDAAGGLPPPLPPPVPPPAVVPPPRPTIQCRVPRVLGLRLAPARARIRRSHCRTGRVRRARVRRARSRRVGRVLAQNPKAGKRRPRGARVNLVVGRR